MSQAVKGYGDNDNRPGDNFLDPVWVASLRTARCYDGHNQRADEGPEYRAFPSTEAASSGKWSYTVLGLEEGPHLVYAAAKVDGETERSVGTTFQAGAGGGTNWILWGLAVVAAILVMRILWGVKLVGATGQTTPPA